MKQIIHMIGKVLAMAKTPTIKMAFIGAGLVAFDQSIEAGALHRMTHVVRTHCFKDGFKKFALDLNGAFYQGRAAVYYQKAEMNWAKYHTNEPIVSRAKLTDTCIKGAIMGAGLFGAGVVMYHTPPETIEKQSGKAAAYGLSATLVCNYLALLLQWPKYVVAGTAAVPAMLLGLRALNNAKQADVNPSDKQRAQDWERVLGNAV